jgi:hypothetical protein
MSKNDKPQKGKLLRVQFPKDETAEGILSGIRKLQDDWALRHPEKAHRLYPKTYNLKGERIIKPANSS